MWHAGARRSHASVTQATEGQAALWPVGTRQPLGSMVKVTRALDSCHGKVWVRREKKWGYVCLHSVCKAATCEDSTEQAIFQIDSKFFDDKNLDGDSGDQEAATMVMIMGVIGVGDASMVLVARFVVAALYSWALHPSWLCMQAPG